MKSAPLLFALALAACSGTVAPGSAPAPSTPSRPVIAALKTHDGKVSITGGGDLRVMVTKDDGTVIADNATLDEVRTKDPETWMLVKSAVAKNGGTTGGTYLDATFVATPAPALH